MHGKAQDLGLVGSVVLIEQVGEGSHSVVYRGHVDDARNTDEAWMETTAVRFHATEEIAAKLQLGVSDTDEIEGVAWYDVDGVTAMYASHLSWLKMVRGAADKPRAQKKRKRSSDDEENDADDAAASANEEPKCWEGPMVHVS